MPLDPMTARWRDVLDRHPAVPVPTARGIVTCRHAGSGPDIVFLHGIGSGSGAWIWQLEGLADRFRLTAWDAPGYGGSERIAAPTANSYAGAVTALLDALEIERAILVGHSLGALIAARLARREPWRLGGLVLSDPAQGHARLTAAERDAKRLARVGLFEQLGPEAHADARAPRMLSADATADQIAHTRQTMAALKADGYGDAAALLATGDLKADLAGIDLPAMVLCGGADIITPPEGVRDLAAAFQGGRPYHETPGAGHASYSEGAEAYNALLAGFAEGLT